MAVFNAQDLVDYATREDFLNTRYVDHATILNWGPGEGWDCSSFTSYIFKSFGVQLPAYSDSQYKMGTKVNKENLQPGDLVFFHTNPNKVTGHVGIYIGNGMMVNAANPSSGTRIQPVTWDTYVGARRVASFEGAVRTPPASGTPVNDAPSGDSVAPRDRSGGIYDTTMPQDELSMKDLKAMYGIAAGVLKKYPELKDAFEKILEDNITDPTLQLAILKETDWFQTHTQEWMDVETARLSKDPAIWNATVAKKAEEVKKKFAESGAEITDEMARKYAEQLLYGSNYNEETGTFEIYDEDWLNDLVAGAIEFNVTGDVFDMSGKAEEYGTQLYELAYQYGYDTSMSNDAFKKWFETGVRGLLSGDMTVQEVDDELVAQATSRFPGLQAQIQRGLTLRQAASPYLKTIADELELDESQLNFNDDLVQRMLNSVDEQGQFKPLSLYDAKKQARRDERWQYTSTAKNEYTTMASTILRDFGFLG